MARSRTWSKVVWLTLVAFSVQLAVAVLHHHSDRGLGIQSRAMTAGMCAAASRLPCLPAAPHSHDNDGCVLCWATAVAANTLVPAPPDLPAPAKVTILRLGTFDLLPPAVVHRDNFRARGPPSAVAA